jgi:hypothetical protein
MRLTSIGGMAGRIPAITLQKNLTRRANHRHIDNIAGIEPAPGNWSRAF